MKYFYIKENKESNNILREHSTVFTNINNKDNQNDITSDVDTESGNDSDDLFDEVYGLYTVVKKDKTNSNQVS